MSKVKNSENHFQKIIRVVRRIPAGKVATYGQVARIAGLDGHARQVGYALHALPGNSGVPWQRVINAKGQISFDIDSAQHAIQRALLEAEGVVFNARGTVSLAKFGWKK